MQLSAVSTVENNRKRDIIKNIISQDNLPYGGNMSYSDDIDPSIAALLAETNDSLPESSADIKADEKQIEQKEYEVQLQKQHNAMMSVPKVKTAFPK